MNLLPKLLLPLAGPEEFDEEENEKLPIELQYLGEEKTRESDADLRKMIIEALTQVHSWWTPYNNCSGKQFCILLLF